MSGDPINKVCSSYVLKSVEIMVEETKILRIKGIASTIETIRALLKSLNFM